MSPVDITNLSSMRLKAYGKCITPLKSKEDVLEFVQKTKENKDKHLIVGGGTNMVFGENTDELVIGKVEIMGKKITKEAEKEIEIEVGAGESWDEFVEFCVDAGYAGIEALSAIPGTVGASPVQNIGAYGQEVKDTILSVTAYSLETNDFVDFSNQECEFSYRNSFFKKNPNKFIISSVTFKLQLLSDLSRRSFAKEDRINIVKIPDYKDVKKYFEDRENAFPTLKEIREAIIEIRKNKLPDPKIIPNCGSFFKNPFVSEEVVNKIKVGFPSLPTFQEENLFKIPAGFLIDSLGFKGQKLGNITVYKNNALVLTNPERASFQDLLDAKELIQKSVFDRFGIMLEPEVNIIN